MADKFTIAAEKAAREWSKEAAKAAEGLPFGDPHGDFWDYTTQTYRVTGSIFQRAKNWFELIFKGLGKGERLLSDSVAVVEQFEESYRSKVLNYFEHKLEFPDQLPSLDIMAHRLQEMEWFRFDEVVRKDIWDRHQELNKDDTDWSGSEANEDSMYPNDPTKYWNAEPQWELEFLAWMEAQSGLPWQDRLREYLKQYGETGPNASYRDPPPTANPNAPNRPSSMEPPARQETCPEPTKPLQATASSQQKAPNQSNFMTSGSDYTASPTPTASTQQNAPNQDNTMTSESSFTSPNNNTASTTPASGPVGPTITPSWNGGENSTSNATITSVLWAPGWGSAVPMSKAAANATTTSVPWLTALQRHQHATRQ